MAIGTYVLRVGSWSGGTFGSLTTLTPNAVVSEVTWELNGPGSLTFEIPTDDSNATAIELIATEIQLLRNGSLIWWGVPIRIDATYDTMQVQCVGIFWYFWKRFIGNTGKVNLISNGSFEDDAPGFPGDLTKTADWTGVGCTFERVSTHKFEGTYGADLAQSVADADTFIYQNVSLTGATGTGTNYELIGWYHIRTDTYNSTLTPQEHDQAIFGRGLYIERHTAGGEIFPYYTMIGPNYGTAMGDSRRDSVSVWVPPGLTETWQVRLYAPKGDIVWDNIQLYSDEALTYNRTDQNTIISNLVDHAQDAAYGKTDLNIGYTGSATSVLRDVSWTFVDKANIGDSLLLFTKLASGLDMSIEYPTALTRNLQTYYPSKGSDKSGSYSLDQSAGQITDWKISDDGENSANAVYYISSYQGIIRDEGVAIDNTTFGGNLLEAVYDAGPDDTHAVLQEAATKRLSLVKNVARAIEITTVPQLSHIDNLAVGDTTDITISRGYISLSAVSKRLVKKTLNPQNDTMKLVFN